MWTVRPQLLRLPTAVARHGSGQEHWLQLDHPQAPSSSLSWFLPGNNHDGAQTGTEAVVALALLSDP